MVVIIKYAEVYISVNTSPKIATAILMLNSDNSLPNLTYFLLKLGFSMLIHIKLLSLYPNCLLSFIA